MLDSDWTEDDEVSITAALKAFLAARQKTGLYELTCSNTLC